MRVLPLQATAATDAAVDGGVLAVPGRTRPLGPPRQDRRAIGGGVAEPKQAGNREVSCSSRENKSAVTQPNHLP